MKTILILMGLVFSGSVFSRCDVFVPVKDFSHDSYSFSFDFTKVLAPKGYQETNDEGSEYQVLIEGRESLGRHFHSAEGHLTMKSRGGREWTYQDSVLCLTQDCTIGDFAKAFNRAYKKMQKELPSCP